MFRMNFYALSACTDVETSFLKIVNISLFVMNASKSMQDNNWINVHYAVSR